MGDIEEIIEIMNSLIEERGVPKNIKASVSEAIDNLRNEKENLTVRINTAISILDEVSNDPNIPVYTRTQVWNIVSMLESLQAE